MDLTKHPVGGYSFLPAIEPYSSGVVAAEGFEIQHVTLQRPVPLGSGFKRMDAYLASVDRPAAALCAVQLRLPEPLEFDGFSDFNARYRQLLEDRGLYLDGVNPVARTNVAPEAGGPAEPSLFAFSFTVPTSAAPTRPTFIVAGGGEVVGGALSPEAIVRRGEVTAPALQEKARFVMEEMLSRVSRLQVTPADVTVVDVYTIHPLRPLLQDLLRPMGDQAVHGVHWYPARPPVREIEFEMDMRGVYRELRLPLTEGSDT